MRLSSCLPALLCLLLSSCGGGSGGGSNGPDSIPAPSRLRIIPSYWDGYAHLDWDQPWLGPTLGYDDYELEAKSGSTLYSKVYSASAPSATWTDYLFPPTGPDNTVYTFRVRIKRKTGYSPYSNEASMLHGPNAPTQVTATYDSATSSMLVNWNRNTTGSDGLRVERSICEPSGFPLGSWVSLPVTTPSASSYLDTSAAPEQYYTYSVINLSGALPSRSSLASLPVYTGVAPAAWVTASYDPAVCGVQVIWGPRPTLADGFFLERSPCDASGAPTGTWTRLSTPTGYQTSFLDRSAPEEMDYIYRVINLIGPSPSLPCPSAGRVWVPLFAPKNLKVAPGAGGLQLNWDNQSASANQVVVRRLSSSFGWQHIATLAPTATTYLDAVPGLGYYSYTVLAKSNANEMSSDPAMASTPNLPGSLALTSTLSAPPLAAEATDAALRPLGTWAFAASNPFGVLSNNDPWPALRPTNVTLWSIPIIQIDRLGLPHAMYGVPNDSVPGETRLTHLWYDGTAWRTEVLVSTKIPGFSSHTGWTFRLDSTGSPHVLLDHSTTSLPSGGSTSSLSYVHKIDGTWTEEPLTSLAPSVDNVGSFHLTLEDSDTPHVLIGNWTTVNDYVRTGPGTWSARSFPVGAEAYFTHDYLEGIWLDAQNGWVFYDGAVNGDPGEHGLWLTQMKAGAWQPPQMLGRREHDGWATTAMAAISPDRARLAVLFATSVGIKGYHQAPDGWHETLVAPPFDWNFPLLRIGMDANQKVHFLTSSSTGFTDHHE